MNFELSAEQQEFCAVFRTFCKKEIAPNSYEWEKAGQVPKHVFRQLAAIGYTGLLFPEEAGGQGASVLEATLAQEILSEYCGSTFFTVGASIGLFGKAIFSYGNKTQVNKILPEIISGNKVGCLGITEPAAGSDVSALTMSAQIRGNYYILNGQKTLITNAPIADYALVLARVSDAHGNAKGLTHILIDCNKPGVSLGKPMEKMGLKASPTGEIFLENVKVPLDNIVGKLGQGFRQTMSVFNFERLALAAYSVGVMGACLHEAKKYANTRRAFGSVIAKHQSVAFMLADIVVKYESAKWLLYQTAWQFDELLKNGGKISKMNAASAMIKVLASTHAREVTNLAVQIHGGAGYMEEYKVARMYRDIKLAEIGGGTSEILMGIIARAEEKKFKA